MTSIIKKSLYFVLGFCLILPMINNSAVANNELALLTISDQDCVARARITSNHFERLRNELLKVGLRYGGTTHTRCVNYLYPIRRSPTMEQLCGERRKNCSLVSFVRTDRRNLNSKDIIHIRKILNKLNIKTMTRNINRKCSLRCFR